MILTICGKESYIRRLSDYIRVNSSYELSIYTDPTALLEELERKKGNWADTKKGLQGKDRLYLIDEDFLREFPDKTVYTGLSEDQLYCLTVEKEKDGLKEGKINFLYKYQSADKLLKVIRTPSVSPLQICECHSGKVSEEQPAAFSELETEKLIDEVRTELESLPGISAEAVYEYIDEAIQRYDKKQKISAGEKQILRKDIFNSIRRLDVLQNYIDDDSVTEIMVNGLHSIFVEKEGRLFDTGRAFSSRERLGDIIQQITDDHTYVNDLVGRTGRSIPLPR